MSAEPFPESDPGVVAVENALKALALHWGSVHICCTRYKNDNQGGYTDTISRGTGNTEARYGSLKQTVIKLEEKMRIDMRKANE